MREFWATFCKDLLVLRRDRAGLLVLFLMPAVLVLVVSLVQNNVLETTGAAGVRILFVDADGGALGQKVRERLGAMEALELVESLNGRPLNEMIARDLVARGQYQFGIVIPAGLGEVLHQRARVSARRALAAEETLEPRSTGAEVSAAVFFDPTVQGIFRTAVNSSLQQVLLGIEAQEKSRELTRALNTAFAARNGGFMGGAALFSQDRLSQVLADENLLPIRQVEAGAPQPLLPNAVQQNVPAWALFGMFFIVVPLSGALLRERQEGTLLRLRILPTSYVVILLGKILAFASVCMVQFSLMLIVGKFLLPLLGTPTLDLEGRLAAAYFLALCAALAATGFGLLVGIAARSYEQASMFGAVSVVIAAALGGVMVPVYVMPRAMQSLSRFSPLSWGLEGFLEIFVRGGNFGPVLDNALCLLGFFIGTLGLSWWLFRHPGGSGR